MFESQESTPWYRSFAGLIAASVILPPVGLLLLWLRRTTPTRVKILGTLVILVLGAGYFYLFTAWRRSGANEAHYLALEQHRAQQHAQGASATNLTTLESSPSPGVATPAANSTDPQQSTTITEASTAHATRNYWTNFRGPNRDGRYEEMQVTIRW